MRYKLLTILVVFLFSISLQAQENGNYNRKIGLTFSSFGENDLLKKNSLVGEASYSGENFYSIGISYLKPLNNWLDLETGLEYSNHTIMIKAAPYPGLVAESSKTNLSIVNVPLYLTQLGYIAIYLTQ